MSYTIETLLCLGNGTDMLPFRPLNSAFSTRKGKLETFIIKLSNRDQGIAHFWRVQDLCEPQFDMSVPFSTSMVILPMPTAFILCLFAAQNDFSKILTKL